MLSVIVITKNAGDHIGSCLETVTWADEIVVVDSGSDDDTVDICRQYTDRVYVHDWPGFGPQKNRALGYATGDWILSIDADERVTPQLRETILNNIRDNIFAAYRMPRQSYYCGRWIRHSGWWPDYVVRLFRRGQARFSDDAVHERVEVSHGEIGTLDEPLLHYSFETLEEVLDKVNRYSSAGAAMRLQRGQRANLRTAVMHAVWAFLRTYFIRAGFLDGREGFMLAVSNAEGVYYRYLKLMYLRRNNAAAVPRRP